MKKIILIPVVCLLFLSSCKLRQMTFESSIESTTKVVNADEIQIKKIDFNHPVFSHPFWAFSFNSRSFKMSDLFYNNN